MELVSKVRGVGAKTLETLNNNQIYKTSDLVFRFPKKYESFKEDSMLFASDKAQVTVTGTLTSSVDVINHQGSLKSVRFNLLVENELYKIVV